MDCSNSTQLVKRCRVCGDQAICFNFDVLTCGPCRLFFYRNVNKPQKWKCFGSGKCEISSANRRACRKCRWDKCVAIGMKPKQHTQNDINLFLNQNIEIALKSALEEEYDEENSSYSNEIITSLPKSMSKNYFEFNQTEMKYIDELLKSSASIFNFEEANLPVLYETSTLYQAFNLGMNYVRRIIKFCKTNSVFRSLNSTEQYQVLKQFINKFLMIRHAFAYDPQIDGFYALGSEDGQGSVLSKPFDHFNDPFVQQLIEMKKKNFIMLNQEMANDRAIRDLLIVQALFNSTQHLSIAESLRYHYWIYNNLLLRYLQCKYRDMEQAQYKHSLLIKVAQESKDEAQEKQFHEALQELDINQFDELTVEVLSI